MSAERLTRLAAKVSTLKPTGKGHGALTQSDIAAACAGMPGWLFHLMLAKYVNIQGRNRLHSLACGYNEIVLECNNRQAAEIAIAAYLDKSLCMHCEGRGVIHYKNRTHRECNDCGGTGKVSYVVSGKSAEVLDWIIQAEIRALERFARGLADDA